MLGMIVGAIAGGAIVWFWRDKMAATLDEKTRTLRQKAADGLDVMEKQTTALLDRAKPQITSTLRAGKEAIQPSESTQSHRSSDTQSHQQGGESVHRAS